MIRLSVVVLVLLGLAGCASTQEIETSPPQPRTGSPDEGAAAQEAPLAIVMRTGETALPADISLLRIRVTEVRLRRSNGQWIRLPSDTVPIEVMDEAQGVRRTLLETRVAPAAYDSLSIAFADVFVRFGANAGGSLTTASDAPQRLALELEPSLGAFTRLVLTLEPGASLSRSPDCRWFFVPVLLTDVESLSLRPSEVGNRQ